MTTKSTKKAAPKKAAKSTPKLPAKPAPKGKAAAKATPAPTTTSAPPTRERDPRLPAAGAMLTRAFKGKEIRVEVLDTGFRYDGKEWRSLSAIAKAVAGVSWNGFLFFNLVKRVAKSTPVAKDGAK